MRTSLYSLLFALLVATASAQVTNVNVGASANDGTGDRGREAFIKVNANDNYLLRHAKGPSIFSVLDYGASVTNAQNNTAFQAAIDAAQAYARANNGATVLVPEGRFLFNTNSPYTTKIEQHLNGILFSNAVNLSFVGAGVGKTVLELATNSIGIRDLAIANGYGWNWFGATNTAGLRVTGFTFDCNGATNPMTEILHFYNTTNCVIENNSFRESSLDCVDIHFDNVMPGAIDAATNVVNHVRFNTFEDWGINGGWGGWYAGGNAIGAVTPMHINNNTFIQVHTNGLNSYAIKNTSGRVLWIYDNEFKAQQAIENEQSSDVVVNNNFFVKTNIGAGVISFPGVVPGSFVLRGNVFRTDTTLGGAMWVKGAHTSLVGVGSGVFTIEDNEFHHVGVKLNLLGTEQVKVKNNMFRASSISSIMLDIRGTNTLGVVVEGNTVTGAGTQNFNLGNGDMDKFDNAVFRNNLALDANLRVWNKGTNVTVSGNYATGEPASGHAFVIGFGACTNWVVEGNTTKKMAYVRNVNGIVRNNSFASTDVSISDGTRFEGNSFGPGLILSLGMSTNAVWVNNSGMIAGMLDWSLYGSSQALARGTNIVPVWVASRVTRATDTNAPQSSFVLTNAGGALTGWFDETASFERRGKPVTNYMGLDSIYSPAYAGGTISLFTAWGANAQNFASSIAYGGGATINLQSRTPPNGYRTNILVATFVTTNAPANQPTVLLDIGIWTTTGFGSKASALSCVMPGNPGLAGTTNFVECRWTNTTVTAWADCLPQQYRLINFTPCTNAFVTLREELYP